MKVKTQDLIGPALHYVVSKLEGETPRIDSYQGRPVLTTGIGDAGTDWAIGGPIIEREGIAPRRVLPFVGEYEADSANYRTRCVGPTYLIAAMRCYVASKLGDEVDVPGRLL